jgi:hypothetical protein
VRETTVNDDAEGAALDLHLARTLELTHEDVTQLNRACALESKTSALLRPNTVANVLQAKATSADSTARARTPQRHGYVDWDSRSAGTLKL